MALCNGLRQKLAYDPSIPSIGSTICSRGTEVPPPPKQKMLSIDETTATLAELEEYEKHLLWMDEQFVPTVEEILESTHIGCDIHEWRVEGGVIRIARDELRTALEEAYDKINPNWTQFVEDFDD